MSNSSNLTIQSSAVDGFRDVLPILRPKPKKARQLNELVL